MNYESKSSANIEIRKKEHTNAPLDMVSKASHQEKHESEWSERNGKKDALLNAC